MPDLIHLDSPRKAQSWCQHCREENHSIGFIPTMGALHAGHLALIQQAVNDNDSAVVSIFVNPLQFNSLDDLDKYPRTLDADLTLLKDAGVSMVFTGEIVDFYPELAAPSSSFTPPDAGIYAKGLEGEHRPGHFEGVREIVKRLFHIVGKCQAYFGEKDFQQTLVIKDLARTLSDIEIVVCPTSREPSGLARSSRNMRLSEADKVLAAHISQALFAARTAWKNGERHADVLRQTMQGILDQPGIMVEYADLRDPSHWNAEAPAGTMKNAQALIAAEIAGVRLIDNLKLE